MLEDATVTVNYIEFQKIKLMADKGEKLLKEIEEDESKKVIDEVCKLLETGIKCESEHKQWYLVQALTKLYDDWGINMDEEFSDIDKGIAP
ncbi:hypothetical protein [Clostridium akagii]|uniref:hypothetical protein n=1 Tax=Clostridium akagii TaxID=91623 RepID=UPI000479F221|nr:hypothetical protein [Clostridium akagii]